MPSRRTATCKPVPSARQLSGAPVRPPWRKPAGIRIGFPGFELTNSAVRKDPETGVQVSSLMYDDGLARFSVFLEPLNGASVTDTRTQLGPTAAVSRRLTTPQGEMMVTVVGEIPIGTAERIALSMRSDATATQ
ncbi:protein of unknown function [Pseudomonas mediterranea]